MNVFAALADPVRRELLGAVAASPKRVADLAASQTISRPAVSRHLRLLAEAGLMEAEDSGRERYYALRTEPLAEVRALLDELIAAPAGGVLSTEALDALATEVRRTTRERRSSRGPTTSMEETA